MLKKTKKAMVRTDLNDLRKGETIKQHNTRLLEEISAGLDLILKKMAEIREETTREATAF